MKLITLQSNVLIDKDGKSYVSDFGMSDIVAEFQGTSYAMSCMRGSVRWAAPELYRLQEPNISPAASTHSDVYSFGCVMFQVSKIEKLYSLVLPSSYAM
jgi:serine/threonine protein kinase